MKDEIISLVEEAGKRILEIYDRIEVEAEVKKDNSPVTEADKRSSDFLYSELSTRFNIPVIDEEKYSSDLRYETFWLVDPLDGTRDFLAKNGEFTVNVALVQDRKPILGIVGVPALGIVYAGEEGKGSIRKEGIRITSISSEPKGRANTVCLDSRFHSSKEVEEFCSINNIETIQRSGSSVKLCRLAEGSADVYPRFGPTSEWDIAAGHCVLAEAGGAVKSLLTGEELEYGKESIKNPPFIAARRGLSFLLPSGHALTRISL